MFKKLGFLTIALCLCAIGAVAQDKPYEQEIDHVYLTLNGQDYYMDIFRPNGKGRAEHLKPTDKGKGLGVVDIASGAWHSDRGKIKDHETAQMYHIFCARGYTVFAVRPGTRPDYDIGQMVSHIKHAIRYIKANAEAYGIDPDRLGITGASAGGHLGLMTLLNQEPGDPDASDPLLKHSTEVAAGAIFFPPTNFLNWESRDLGDIGKVIGEILFVGGAEGKSKEEVEAKAREYSPLFHVKPGAPPVYIMHGDADTVVPLSQSTQIVEAMKAAGNEIEFFIKEGGTHPWLTIPLEIIIIADWFDEVLNRETPQAAGEKE